MRKYFSYIVAGVIGMALIILADSVSVRANHVIINSNLSVSPGIISFATVFPGEVHFKPLDINLSDEFLQSPIHDDVEYRILQKIKPRTDSDTERAYCQLHPTDYMRCYPSLCPYLSKEADNDPQNDTSVPAFHDPTASSSIAYGHLAKSAHDIADHWTIDLHTPCFRGQCDQANTVPPHYQLDQQMNGHVFGCDLVVEVTNVSFNECIEDRISVVDGSGSDPSPLHIHSYSDLNTCSFTTSHDVIIDGAINYPTTCKGASITAPAIKEESGGSVNYTRGDSDLALVSNTKGITLGGSVKSVSKEPIKITSNAGILLDGATVHNSDSNGDVLLIAKSNILVASSTLTSGPNPPATTGGDLLQVQCNGVNCQIEILGTQMNARVLKLNAQGSVTMRGSKLNGRDPRGDYSVTSTYGTVDLGGGKCDKPNMFSNSTEGNLTVIASRDIVLDDSMIRIPENIKGTAGNSISMLRADISNDFGKPGDITMQAGFGANTISFQDAKIVDDNQGLHNFATLNGGDNPTPLQRAAHHVVGTPALDN